MLWEFEVWLEKFHNHRKNKQVFTRDELYMFYRDKKNPEVVASWNDAKLFYEYFPRDESME